MSENKKRKSFKLQEDPYKIETESLADSGATLQSFYFRFGGNFHVFSYDCKGTRRHTFIDTGHVVHRKRILPVLTTNGIDPGHIERIIITHRHTDHCGLADLLARKSQATILAHANFRECVEGNIGKIERLWLGKFKPSQLQKQKMEYLEAGENGEKLSIAGVTFPRLKERIILGDAGRLDIVACPENASPHTRDQLIVLYSAPSCCRQDGKDGANNRDATMMFPGDLWLMQAPLVDKDWRHYYRTARIALWEIKGWASGKPLPRWDPREQDMEAKEALKRGFSLIRVKPGHGEEFLGSRIIPRGLLAERDILLLLGYAMDDDKELLKLPANQGKVREVLEKAHQEFREELKFWLDQGKTERAIGDILCRIYREQRGGGKLVQQDREERRARMKETLIRIIAEDRERMKNAASLCLARLP